MSMKKVEDPRSWSQRLRGTPIEVEVPDHRGLLVAIAVGVLADVAASYLITRTQTRAEAAARRAEAHADLAEHHARRAGSEARPKDEAGTIQ